MKAVLIADFHIHSTPDWRFKWLSEFVDTLLDIQDKDYQGYDLYLLGDVLESRDNVSSKCLNLLIHLITNWKTGKVFWLTGQHDSWIPGHATLEGLEETGIVKIIDRDVYHDEKSNIWFVPYARKEQDYRSMLSKVPDGATLMTHMPIVEIIEMYGAKNVQGISLKEFDRFNQTYSGDIHKYHDFKKFFYIGAPSQRDWRDKGAEGIFATLVDGKFTRLETGCPVHIEVSDQKDIPKGVKCIIRSKKGVQIEDSPDILQSSTKVEIKAVSVRLEVVSESTIISDYTKKNPVEGIKPSILEESARSILKEAESA